ncbi:DgyrCDS14239 [Dimorphilus gyrociliatus]|uniref:DgyrCDS14239 n=1 Tax=Dimorphilus gyrociliatus TaxID=2664684 RepID=A0A7I8WD30_9ANNE|nr:DgyrCDS14239 [Dimorphilus gyrociliatus]
MKKVVNIPVPSGIHAYQVVSLWDSIVPDELVGVDVRPLDDGVEWLVSFWIEKEMKTVVSRLVKNIIEIFENDIGIIIRKIPIGKFEYVTSETKLKEELTNVTITPLSDIRRNEIVIVGKRQDIHKALEHIHEILEKNR